MYTIHCIQTFAQIQAEGGEGLVIRDPTAEYAHGTTNSMYKIKAYDDDEAVVIGYNWIGEKPKRSLLCSLNEVGLTRMMMLLRITINRSVFNVNYINLLYYILILKVILVLHMYIYTLYTLYIVYRLSFR